METFTEPTDFAPHPNFDRDRKKALKNLNLSDIDLPIVDLIETFTRVPWCFTLQCCWGHFVHDGQPDPRGCDPLANYQPDTQVRFQLAYLAVCIKDTQEGRLLHDNLRNLVSLDPANVQFGSADWFTRKQVNIWVIQVEPERFKKKDRAYIGIKEALFLEKLKARMFTELRKIASRHSQPQ
jgi:hypothetical protein